MKGPKSFGTFLEGFNLGAVLSLISLGDVLLKSSTLKVYIMILVLIITSGIVVGCVRQYFLIQLTLMKNMRLSFVRAKDQIPPRLIEIHQYKKDDMPTVLRGISLKLQMNMYGACALLVLLLLTLWLPVVYAYQFSSKMLIFSVMWMGAFSIYSFHLMRQMREMYRFLQKHLSHLIELNQVNQQSIQQNQG